MWVGHDLAESLIGLSETGVTVCTEDDSSSINMCEQNLKLSHGAFLSDTELFQFLEQYSLECECGCF